MGGGNAKGGEGTRTALPGSGFFYLQKDGVPYLRAEVAFSPEAQCIHPS